MKIQAGPHAVRRLRHLRQTRPGVLLARRLGLRVVDRRRHRARTRPRRGHARAAGLPGARDHRVRRARPPATRSPASSTPRIPPSRTSEPRTTKRSRDSSVDQTAPAAAHRRERVLLDLGGRRPAAHPGVPELPGADPSARAGLPVLPQPRTWACAPSPARPRSSAFTVNHRFGFPDLPAAVRGGAGRDRGGSASSADHQHHRMRPRRARARPARRGRLPAASTTSGCRCSGRPPSQSAPTALPEDEIAPRGVRQVRPADAHQGEVRGPLGDHRHRHVEDRPPADGAAAVADHRGVRGRPSPTPD